MMSDVDIEEKEFAQKEKDQEFFQKLDKFVEPIMKIKRSEGDRNISARNAAREHDAGYDFSYTCRFEKTEDQHFMVRTKYD